MKPDKRIKIHFLCSQEQASHWLMYALILTIGVINFFWGEKVPAGGGFGWDGVTYADMVKNIDSIIREGKLSNYYAHRLLPSVIVRGLIYLFEIPPSNINIIRVFEVFNLGLLLGSCWVWKKISDVLGFSLRGRWLGFLGIFANFAFSKQAFYMPVLTDVAALFSGMLMLWFYLTRKSAGIALVALSAAFVWPSASLSGAVLLVFLYVTLPENVVRPPSNFFLIKWFNSKRFFHHVTFILAISVVGYIFFKLYRPHSIFVSFFTGMPSAFFLLLGLWILGGSVEFFTRVVVNLKFIRMVPLILALSVIMIPFLVAKMISNPELFNPNTPDLLLRLILLPPEGKFFLPLLALVLMWGPSIFLLAYLWDKVSMQARALGPAVVGVIALHLPLILVCESRFLILAWPFLIVCLVKSLEQLTLTIKIRRLFFFLTVFFAQFWMKLNWAKWSVQDYEGLNSFPKQIYFMHTGLWMSWASYVIQLPVVLLLAILVYKEVKRIRYSKQ